MQKDGNENTDFPRVAVAELPTLPKKKGGFFRPIKSKIDTRFLWMAIVTGVSFVLLLTYVVYVGNIAPMIFARNAAKSSAVKSMVFAYPLTITQSTGESMVKVFIIAENGSPIPDKVVTLSTNFGNVSPATAKTDDTGTAAFVFSSSETGIAELTPYADSQKIAQTVTIKVSEE